jgi:putative tryptophan/tyrosine transport system substrate-binding protein
VQDAGRLTGLPIDILKASTSREYREVFAKMVRERIEALFIDGDRYFTSRRVQLVALATRHRIAASYVNRDFSKPAG